jgi:CrcB protein
VIVLWVACGAAVGAPARYLVDRAIQSRHRSQFPFGTLTVNLIACFVLGIMTGLGKSASPAMVALIGTGFCATLSTYSTFSFETMRLLDLRAARTATGYVALSLVAGCGTAALGWWLGAAVR